MTQDCQQLYRNLLKLSWQFNSIRCPDDDSCDDFTLTDLMALRIVEENCPCPTQAISLHLGITKSGATRVVKRLENRGLITCHSSPEDGRLRCLTLTPEAHHCLKIVAQKQSRRLEQALSSLDDDTRRHLQKGLNTLAEQITSPQASPDRGSAS